MFLKGLIASLILFSSPSFAGGWGALGGLGKAMTEIGESQMEQDRQKELIRYQHQLEMERMDRQSGSQPQQNLTEHYRAPIWVALKTNATPINSVEKLNVTREYNCPVNFADGRASESGVCIEYSVNVNGAGVQKYKSFIMEI